MQKKWSLLKKIKKYRKCPVLWVAILAAKSGQRDSSLNNFLLKFAKGQLEGIQYTTIAKLKM